ncbi:MAG: p-hydroxybenzoate 3-monooxygenase [bacterium]|jgi:hypothetical protein
MPATVYAIHEDGFAGHMARTETVTRYYLQCGRGADPAAWSAERIWDELARRMRAERFGALREGQIFERVVVEMTSTVIDPIQSGSLCDGPGDAHFAIETSPEIRHDRRLRGCARQSRALHDSHAPVAKDRAGLHPAHRPANDMQVGAADRRRGEAHDRVRGYPPRHAAALYYFRGPMGTMKAAPRSVSMTRPWCPIRG